MTEITMGDRAFLADLQPGDKVLRLLSSAKIPMIGTVKEIKHNLIILDGDWTFNLESGVEEDPAMGWGARFGVVASWLERKATDEDIAVSNFQP